MIKALTPIAEHAVMARPAPQTRNEGAVFSDLRTLCHSPGYIHAIARICLRDNMISYEGMIKPEDMLKLYRPDKLLRNEVNVCLGLWVQGERDFACVDRATVEQYIEQTRLLLEEIHEAMTAPIAGAMSKLFEAGSECASSLGSGDSMREAIFYGGESAYPFQYRDFSPMRYKADEEWIVGAKGFSMTEAADIARALCRLIDRRANELLVRSCGDLETIEWPLDLFTFTANEVAAAAKMPIEKCRRALGAFAYPIDDRNDGFTCVDARNMAALLPIVRREDHYVLFNSVDLFEVLYQAPYFWMLGDKKYQPAAAKNRGNYTEDFAHTRLASVFGQTRTLINVKLMRSQEIAGEIDVLVVFSKLAVVLQAKSKQLTAAARQGNEKQIQSDFAAAVQAACDQGMDCASLVCDPQTRWVGPNGGAIERSEIEKVFVICLVADHYPALAAQARQFLKFEPVDNVAPPLVMDVFLLDAMAEMLDSPLHFLNYLSRRCAYADAVIASHELNILGYHLSHNLWMGKEANLFHLWDDFGIDLELSMLARRDGLDAPWTPPGVLTLLAETTLGKLVKSIERKPDPGMVDLGFAVLEMSGEAVRQASAAIDELTRRTRTDGLPHDFTTQMANGVGLTFHSSAWPEQEAREYLADHCARRKYVQRATRWFGVVVDPESGAMRFGLMLDGPWFKDPQMSLATAHMRRSSNVTKAQYRAFAQPPKQTKVGRNQSCPCGSGSKSKRCCGE
jgi:uncharacterized protein YchJ